MKVVQAVMIDQKVQKRILINNIKNKNHQLIKVTKNINKKFK